MSELKKELERLNAESIVAAAGDFNALKIALADISSITGASVAYSEHLHEMSSAFEKGFAATDLAAQLKQSFNQHDQLLRAALGPWDDLKLLLENDFSHSLTANFTHLLAPIEALNSGFRIPALTEYHSLAFDATQAAALSINQSLQSSLETAMAQMNTPWLDTNNTLASVRGLANLQILGASLDRFAPFEDSLTERLRTALGDWRDEVADIANIAGSFEARIQAYAERGFDSALTNFPAPAFDQGTTLARIQLPAAALLVLYDHEILAQDTQEAVRFERTNKAHGRLLRFETRIRQFIETRMILHFGQNWIRQGVPPEIAEQWADKAKKAVNSGDTSRPAIAFADFTDYEKIICRRDNWRQIFAPFFTQQESVRESFQRLQPVRLATMHARLITQDDELCLYVETRRLLKAIGVVT